jgi:hypothetical protein
MVSCGDAHAHAHAHAHRRKRQIECPPANMQTWGIPSSASTPHHTTPHHTTPQESRYLGRGQGGIRACLTVCPHACKSQSLKQAMICMSSHRSLLLFVLCADTTQAYEHKTHDTCIMHHASCIMHHAWALISGQMIKTEK